MIQTILIAAIAGGVWLTGREIVKGVKKVSHETVCIVKHGHPCPKKK